MYGCTDRRMYGWGKIPEDSYGRKGEGVTERKRGREDTATGYRHMTFYRYRKQEYQDIGDRYAIRWRVEEGVGTGGVGRA
jgi:hypothetical protein